MGSACATSRWVRGCLLTGLLLAIVGSVAKVRAQPPAEDPPAEPDAETPPGTGEESAADTETSTEAEAEGEPQEPLEGQPEEPLEGQPEEQLEGQPEEQLEPYEPIEEPPAAARVPRTVCHGRTIRRIQVAGARRVEPDDIRASIELRTGMPCTDAEVTQAARELWDLGFFDDIVIEATAVGERRVDLRIRVRERPAVGRIAYEGHDEVSEEDLDEKVTLREGSILSIPDVQRQVDKIRDLYAEKGYFLARVNYRLRRLPGETNEVEVRFVIQEGDEVSVRQIRFLGNENIPDDELEGIMQTSEKGLFSFITEDDTFNRDAFDDDLTRLQAYYYDQGYLAMSLTSPRVELTADRRYIDITIPLEEGPRFKISGVTIAEVDAEGSEIEPLAGREWLREEIDAEPGDWFSRSRIAQSLQAITRFYRDQGYAKVEIVPQTDLDMEERTVDVTVAIRRGPLVRIERINVQGNSKTRDAVIRREVQILEGELYSQTKIERSRERIQALGYFERVDLSEERGSTEERIVLNFQVAERSTGTFQVGFGFSSIESIILTAQIQQQNLFGRGQSLSLQLQLSGIRQNGVLRFTEPYFLGTPWSLSVQAFKTIRQFRSFSRDSTGGGMTLGHPLFDDRLRLFLQYRAEFVDISARTGGFFGRGSGSGLNALPDQLPLDNLRDDGLTSSVQLALTWDSRDNRLFPTEGIFTSLSTEVADSFLGSDNIFVRNEFFFRFFRQLWGPLVLRLNTEVGLITSRSKKGVPIFERYFLGGIYDVRGFPLNSLGPRGGLPFRLDPTAAIPLRGQVVGGNLQAYYNLEIEFPILEAVGIRGVVFTDGGNAWNLEDTLCDLPPTEVDDPAAGPCGLHPHIRASWGFGFRWFSPLGPLRFEWGLPFKARDFEDRLVFEFTIGNFF